MIKTTFISLLILANLKSDCYDLQIISKSIKNNNLKISIKNTSSKKIVFYYGLYQTNFKVTTQNGEENVGETTSIYSGEDYLDYQFDYSKSLVDKTMKKYSISFQEAVIYLHYKNKYVIIPPNYTEQMELSIIKRNSTTKYKLDSTQPYFLSLYTTYSTDFIPKYVRDSLRSKNIEIITPEINANKIRIDINNFFKKHKNYYVK
jgi:hypothetical protein